MNKFSIKRAEITEVKNVNEAVDLATTYKKQGRYVFFRGQVNASWKVVSSLARRQHSEMDDDYYKRIMRFFEFCKMTPELSHLMNSEHADETFSIMQHYGIPTHYIDFTRDPGIAAFFATDGENIAQGQYSSIICLKQEVIDSINLIFREKYKVKNPDIPDKFLLEIDVTHLWRLQAQKGVFLFMPDPNFEETYALDRIVFPYSGPVQSPSRDDIYPLRRSPLEILLDHYFDNERKLIRGKQVKEWFSELQKKNPDSTFYLESKDTLSSMKDNLKNEAKSCSSWMNPNIKKWHQSENTNWGELQTNIKFEISSEIFDQLPLIAKTQMKNQFLEQLQSERIPRNQLIGFEFSGNKSVVSDETANYLFKCLRKIWDGMRYLPFTDEEISSVLSSLTLIFINAHQFGIDAFVINPAQVKELYGSLLTEDYFQIELAGVTRGASSRALISRISIAHAFRQDLFNIVLDKHRKSVQFRYENAELILKLIPDPKWLYEFDQLRKLFVEEIIPTQVFLRSNRDDNPLFFSPVHVSVIGRP